MVCVLWLGNEGPTLLLFFLPNTNVLILRDPRCCLLGGRDGGKEGAGVSVPWHSCTGVSAAPRHCSSSPDGGQSPGGVGRLLLCSPKLPAGCFALPLSPEWHREPRSPPCYPRRWVQMTPLLTCA